MGESQVWMVAIVTRTKPSGDPQRPSGERRGMAASCCGDWRRRKRMRAARETSQARIIPVKAAPIRYRKAFCGAQSASASATRIPKEGRSTANLGGAEWCNRAELGGAHPVRRRDYSM